MGKLECSIVSELSRLSAHWHRPVKCSNHVGNSNMEHYELND